MPDDSSPPILPTTQDSPPPAEPSTPIPFDIGEEFGTAKKNLPSLKIVGIVVAIIAIIAAIVGFVQKPRQKATGTVDNVVSVEIPNQNQLMVGIEISIHNRGEKPFLPREVKAELESDNGSFTDQAASGVDFPQVRPGLPALAVRRPIHQRKCCHPAARLRA